MLSFYERTCSFSVIYYENTKRKNWSLNLTMITWIIMKEKRRCNQAVRGQCYHCHYGPFSCKNLCMITTMASVSNVISHIFCYPTHNIFSSIKLCDWKSAIMAFTTLPSGRQNDKEAEQEDLAEIVSLLPKMVPSKTFFCLFWKIAAQMGQNYWFWMKN